LYTYTI